MNRRPEDAPNQSSINNQTRRNSRDAADAETLLETAETERETGVAAASAETAQIETAATKSATAQTSSASTKSIARSAGIVSVAVMGSRLLGLVREQVMAKYFGAGFLMDAFVVAFRIPNLLRDLFAEGALSAAFVKTFTAYTLDEAQGEEAAWRLANMVMNLLVVVLSLIVVVGIIFSPQLVDLMTRTFSDGFSSEKAALATTMTRIMFPFLILVALAAVAMGVLNTKGRFGVPASASTLFNVGSIVGGLLFAFLLSGGEWTKPTDPTAVPERQAQLAIIGMSIGTLIGGLCQFLVQIPSLYRVGFRFRPLLSVRDAGVRRVMRLMTPAVIGTAAVQINVVVNTLFATDINGGASWLNYSFRLMQFPIGVFGVAIGTATLPAISRLAVQRDIPRFRETLASSINLVFLLTIPSACGLIVLGQPIIRLIYERGAFSALSTDMAAYALAAYSVGLAGYAAIKVLSPAFYALDDARTPMVVSLLSILVNAVANYIFKIWFARYGVTAQTPDGFAHVGLALSTSLVALINFLVLIFFMRRKLRRLEAGRMIPAFVKILVASAVLSAVSFASYRALLNYLGAQGFSVRLFEVLIPMFLGGTSFFLVAKMLRVEELNQAIASFSRKFKRRS